MARSRFNTARLRGAGVIAYDPLQITGILPGGVVGQAYSFTPGTSGGSGTKTFALTGSLPSGLSFSTSTGAITGTPTTAGTTSGLTIAVTDTSGTAKLSGVSIATLANGSASASASSGLRFGTTGCHMPNSYSSGNKFFNARKRKIARTRLVNPRVILPNFYMATSGTWETGTGAAATFTYAILFRGGLYQATFNGATQGVASNLSYIVSDPIQNLDIPKGSAFFENIWASFPGGMPYWSDATTGNRQNGAAGELFEFSATTLPDRTMSSAPYSSNETNYCFGSIGIVTMTSDPALFVIGDSVAAGFTDVSDGTTDLGIVTRALGPFVGYCNAAASSDNATAFMANHGLRVALGNAYASHLIYQLGVNDLGKSLATLKSEALTIRNYFPNLIAIQATTTPNTSGTFSTGSGQTPSANETKRTQWNDYKRAGNTDFDGWIDFADLVETDASTGGFTTVRNGGRWMYPGITADGLHPTPAGYARFSANAHLFRASLGL